MKKFTKFLFVLIVIFSLSLNVLLLYDKSNNKTNKEQIEINDVKNNEEKVVSLNKEQISKLFKDYLSEANLTDPDNLAVFEITKITNVGYFKSNENKKLYYIDEKYNCLEGANCVKTTAEIKTDEEYNNYTTIVVAITPVDENTALFEILDYSIENNSDFVKIKSVEIK